MTLVRERSTPRAARSTNAWSLMPGLQELMHEFEPTFGELASPLAGGGSWATGYPIDLYETANEVILEMAVPGIPVEDIDVSIEGRQLTIQGRLPDSETEAERRYWLRTIPRGEFRRTVTLPGPVDLDEVHARVDQGLLVLTLPKAADARARKIDVRAG